MVTAYFIILFIIILFLTQFIARNTFLEVKLKNPGVFFFFLNVYWLDMK